MDSKELVIVSSVCLTLDLILALVSFGINGAHEPVALFTVMCVVSTVSFVCAIKLFKLNKVLSVIYVVLSLFFFVGAILPIYSELFLH